MESYKIVLDRINLLIDTTSVLLSVDIAVPCGLVLNELLTNALQHAFPNGRAGEIKITLRRALDGAIMLEVSDNGVGVPEDFDFRRHDTVGLMLIFNIGERQLRGDVMFEANNGLTCKVQFKDIWYTPRV